MSTIISSQLATTNKIDEAYDWFKTLDGAKRIDFLNGLLHLCFPLELRFIGSCIEELARKDYNYLRDAEVKANTAHEILSMHDISDKVTRSKMIVTLALLNSTNEECAKLIYHILNIDIRLMLDSMLIDETIADEFLLLFTMACNHPAFDFAMKTCMCDQLRKVEDKLKYQSIVAIDPSKPVVFSLDGSIEPNAFSSYMAHIQPAPIVTFNPAALIPPTQLHVPQQPINVDTKCVINSNSVHSANSSNCCSVSSTNSSTTSSTSSNNSSLLCKNTTTASSLSTSDSMLKSPNPAAIKSVNFEGVHAVQGTDKYKFKIKVHWTDGSVNEIGKTYSELCEFHKQLMALFVDELSGIVDVTNDLLPKENLKDDFIKELPIVTEYCNKIVNLPASVSQSGFVCNFLKGKEDSTTSTTSTITQQSNTIENTLNEDSSNSTNVSGGELLSVDEPPTTAPLKSHDDANNNIHKASLNSLNAASSSNMGSMVSSSFQHSNQRYNKSDAISVNTAIKSDDALGKTITPNGYSEAAIDHLHNRRFLSEKQSLSTMSSPCPSPKIRMMMAATGSAHDHSRSNSPFNTRQPFTNYAGHHMNNPMAHSAASSSYKDLNMGMQMPMNNINSNNNAIISNSKLPRNGNNNSQHHYHNDESQSHQNYSSDDLYENYPDKRYQNQKNNRHTKASIELAMGCGDAINPFMTQMAYGKAGGAAPMPHGHTQQHPGNRYAPAFYDPLSQQFANLNLSLVNPAMMNPSYAALNQMPPELALMNGIPMFAAHHPQQYDTMPPPQPPPAMPMNNTMKNTAAAQMPMPHPAHIAAMNSNMHQQQQQQMIPDANSTSSAESNSSLSPSSVKNKAASKISQHLSDANVNSDDEKEYKSRKKSNKSHQQTTSSSSNMTKQQQVQYNNNNNDMKNQQQMSHMGQPAQATMAANYFLMNANAGGANPNAPVPAHFFHSMSPPIFYNQPYNQIASTAQQYASTTNNNNSNNTSQRNVHTPLQLITNTSDTNNSNNTNNNSSQPINKHTNSLNTNSSQYSPSSNTSSSHTPSSTTNSTQQQQNSGSKSKPKDQQQMSSSKSGGSLERPKSANRGSQKSASSSTSENQPKNNYNSANSSKNESKNTSSKSQPINTTPNANSASTQQRETPTSCTPTKDEKQQVFNAANNSTQNLVAPIYFDYNTNLIMPSGAVQPSAFSPYLNFFPMMAQPPPHNYNKMTAYANQPMMVPMANYSDMKANGAVSRHQSYPTRMNNSNNGNGQNSVADKQFGANVDKQAAFNGQFMMNPAAAQMAAAAAVAAMMPHHHHHHPQQQQQHHVPPQAHSSQTHANHPQNYAAYQPMMMPAAAATQFKKKSCFNCGSTSHIANECKEATIENMNHPTQYRLNFKPNKGGSNENAKGGNKGFNSQQQLQHQQQQNQQQQQRSDTPLSQSQEMSITGKDSSEP